MLPIFRDPERCRVFVTVCEPEALTGGSVQSRRLGQKRLGINMCNAELMQDAIKVQKQDWWLHVMDDS